MFRSIDCCAWDDLGQYFDADIVYERPGYEAFVGLARVLRFYANERVVLSGAHKVESLLGSQDSLVCVGSFAGVSHTNTVLSVRFADYYQLRSGLIVFRRTYFYSPSI